MIHVINELLAFLRNVLGYMDEESIQQLCKTSFTADDIVKTKLLLFESIANAKKMPIRCRDGKKETSLALNDIICLMTTTAPELFPIFVAKELHKLYPVTFDHVDVKRLLKDILKLQNQLNALEEKFVTTEKFELLNREIEHMKHVSLLVHSAPHSNVKRRGIAYLQNSPLNSGPIGLQYVVINNKRSRNIPVSHSPVATIGDELSITFLQEQKDVIETTDIYEVPNLPNRVKASGSGNTRKQKRCSKPSEVQTQHDEKSEKPILRSCTNQAIWPASDNTPPPSTVINSTSVTKTVADCGMANWHV